MANRTYYRSDYSPFAQWFGRTALRLLGWRLRGHRPEEPKCVIPCVPHTSNWDLFYTLLAAMALRVPMVFMMKSNWFFWPLGPIFRWLGGVPVNRSKSTNAVEQMVKEFRERTYMNLCIPPEGTRKKVEYWKTGFYWIAVGAGIPLMPGVIKYDTREVGVGPLIYLTGDIDSDFEKIREYYYNELGIEAKLKPRTEENPGADTP